MSETGQIANETRHVPVLCAEVIGALGVRDGGLYVDGTFGAGGYSRAMLDAVDCQVIAIDQDPDAIAAGDTLVKQYEGRLRLIEGRFGDMAGLLEKLSLCKVDGVALDIGVSSMQLDSAERGFSFRFDGPLDMRMDQGAGDGRPSAADVVNTASEGLLVRIISVLGEERRAKAVARAILRARDEEPIATTRQLANVVEKVVHANPAQKSIHPATRTFQALRIYVNRELDELVAGLSAAEQILAPGGRLAVVSFHSLEDRIVKRFFAGRTGRAGRGSRHMPEAEGPEPSFKEIFKGNISAGVEEFALNPRARSARLRAGERTSAPFLPVSAKALGLPVFEPSEGWRR
ncbi:MAG: 16S rRNA (cytosine(1402)-N(4))-methyltransferase RsmH [Hyphomicrobiales bacterium]